MDGDVLEDGLLQGRLPARKEFFLYYLELTTSQLHIFDGQDANIRKHIQSIRIDCSDIAGVETKVRKGEFRFYLNRPGDGKYIFKVESEADRERWIGNIQRVISRDNLDGSQTLPHNAVSPTGVDMPSRARGDSRTLPSKGRLASGGNSSVLNTSLPPLPPPSPQGAGVNSPRASIISTDSGIGTSVGGEVRRPPLRRNGSNSMPNSGSGMFERGTSGSSGSSSHHSADAEFRHRVAVSSEDQPKWFWGTMSRQECEDELKERGEIGNFVVRVNATGHHIMSFWRVDGVHHHKILTHEGIWRFEKAAVSAEGESLADLLDTYMKNCTKDKNIKPFGGGLFDNYTYAWAPQEFDMDLLGKKLKQQKELREKAAKKPRRKQEYTPVEIDTGLDDEKGGFENDPEPGEETTIKMKSKNKPLPLPPGAKPKSPRPSPGATLRSSAKSPAELASNGDSGRKPSQSQAKTSGTGMALIQELTKKKSLKVTTSKAAGSHNASPLTKRVKENKPLPSTPKANKAAPPSSTVDQQVDGESEPMYANALTPAHAGGKAYQNCDFSGPPSATPTSTAGAAPPPGATPTSAGSEYQNINFGVQKPQTKKKPKSAGGARSPRVASAGTHSSPGGPQVNGSVAGNSASGEYQNFQFGVQKK